MATATGKAARKRNGTRAAARRAKRRSRAKGAFGKLPVSVVSGTAEAFIRRHSQDEQPAWTGPSLLED